jgi:cell division protein FtsL
MAQDDFRYYNANGSAAYDAYSYRGNAAEELAAPQELPQEQPRPRKRVRVKVKAAVAPFTLFGMMAAVCMLVLVVFGYVQLYEATTNVSRLESKLQSLNQEQVLLKSKYEGKIDLAAIEARASELGLSEPTQDQTVYVNLTGSDRAEIFTEKKSSVVGEIVGAVQQSISDLITYLHPSAA